MLLAVITGWLQYCELKKNDPSQDNAVYNILRHNYDLLMRNIIDDKGRYVIHESIRSIAMKVNFSKKQKISVGHMFMPNTSIRILDKDSITNVTSTNREQTKIL